MTPRIPHALSPIQHRIFWFVALSPAGVSHEEIFERVYDGADGGPFDNIIQVHINHMNTKLAPYGLRVARNPPRRPRAKYELRRLDNGNIWLPLIGLAGQPSNFTGGRLYAIRREDNRLDGGGAGG